MHHDELKKFLRHLEALSSHTEISVPELQHDLENQIFAVNIEYTNVYRLISRLAIASESYAEELIKYDDYDGTLCELNSALCLAVKCMLNRSFDHFYKSKALIESYFPQENKEEKDDISKEEFRKLLVRLQTTFQNQKEDQINAAKEREKQKGCVIKHKGADELRETAKTSSSDSPKRGREKQKKEEI